MSTVTLAGGEIEVLDIPGVQPVIALLHEGLGCVGLWRDFPHALNARTHSRIVAFSRYGHGHSEPPQHPRTPSFMHEEALDTLPQLLEALDIDRPLLIGHSDGASIALIYAARHPVEGVVAIAPHVFVEPMCIEQIRLARETYEAGELRQRMARHHRDPDAAFYGWNDVWLHPEFPRWDIRPLLENVGTPLLLIQGKGDQYGTLAQLDAVERAVKTPVERVHLDCRHAPHLEKPAETIRAIARYVTARRSADIAPPPAARTRR